MVLETTSRYLTSSVLGIKKMRVCQGVIISLLGLGSLRMLYSGQVPPASASAGAPVSQASTYTSPYRLCQVHILCRHGARTPINVIPGVEEVSL